MCAGIVISAHLFFIWRCSRIKPNNDNEQLVNEEIAGSGISLGSMVRVIGANGEQLGIITLSTALNTAYDDGLDLVLMSGQSNPPVCKIMDYGKFCFDRDKKKKEAKKKQQRVEIKEVQLSCKIDVNDFNTKANNAKRFLKSGNKVRVLVNFRGREMAHQEVGKNLLEKFAADVAEFGTVDKAPVMEGRSMTMLINPVKQTATTK